MRQRRLLRADFAVGVRQSESVADPETGAFNGEGDLTIIIASPSTYSPTGRYRWLSHNTN